MSASRLLVLWRIRLVHLLPALNQTYAPWEHWQLVDSSAVSGLAFDDGALSGGGSDV